MATAAPTLLESLQAGNDRLPRALTVHPAIADTSPLVSDVMASLNHGQVSPLLAAMKLGIVRLLVAQHVWAEVPRKLAQIAAQGRLDHPQAEALWWNEYVPLIRVVDTASVPASVHDAVLAARDTSDLPTARLHGILAPVATLASDHDLTDLGLTIEHWRATAATADALTEIGGTAFAGNFALNLTIGAAGVSAHSLGRLLRHPAAPSIVVGLAVTLALTYRLWRPSLDDRSSRLKAAAVNAWPSIESIIIEYGDRLTTTYDRWDAASTGTPGTTEVHAIARLLVSSPALTRRQIAERLHPQATEGELRRIITKLAVPLHGCSAFAPTGRGRWQIGRAGADFGGLLRPVAMAEEVGPPTTLV